MAHLEFFGFPPEIRNEIYRLALQSEAPIRLRMRRRYHRMKIVAEVDVPVKPSERTHLWAKRTKRVPVRQHLAPALLRTCKQICTEAMPFLWAAEKHFTSPRALRLLRATTTLPREGRARLAGQELTWHHLTRVEVSRLVWGIPDDALTVLSQARSLQSIKLGLRFSEADARTHSATPLSLGALARGTRLTVASWLACVSQDEQSRLLGVLSLRFEDSRVRMRADVYDTDFWGNRTTVSSRKVIAAM